MKFEHHGGKQLNSRLSQTGRGRRCALALAVAVGVGVGPFVTVPAFASVAGDGVVINEAYLSGGSNGAAFTHKFVELYNPTGSAVSLDDMSLQYRSATGSAAFTGVQRLSGSIEAGGYYLVQMSSNGANGAALPSPDVTGSLNPSGTTGTLALVQGTSAVTLPTGNVAGQSNIVDLLGYGTSNTFESKAATSPNGTSDVRSMNRTDAVDTDNNSDDFTLSASITPQGSGGAGPDPTPSPSPSETDNPSDATPMSIADVQGTGAASEHQGKRVVVEGVMTADYRTGGYKGVVIQTQGTGGAVKSDGASDGIFVFLGSTSVPGDIGDLVSVTGTVSEYFGQTQISVGSSADVSLVTAAVGVPEPVTLPADVVGTDREEYENMLVQPGGDWLIASSHQLYNFGTLWINPSELNVKSTEQVAPGDEAQAIAAANRASRILLDDGYSIQISNNDHPAEQPYFTKDAVVRNGDRVDFGSLGMVLQYGFDDWRLQPVMPIDSTSLDSAKVSFEQVNVRTDAPVDVGGDARVAAFNVYNYFTTLSSEDPNARGAKDAERFETQKSKIVAAINDLDADIVALMEIENSIKFNKPIDTALADLVDGLNKAAGSKVWAYVSTPAALNNAATTDFITNAIIYKTDAVTPQGASMTITDESVWNNAREPIAQAFDIDGRVVTVVANHFKSKSGSGTEPADGQGHFNGDRVKQAQSLLEFTDEIATSTGSDDMLLIGDFNAYSKEDPISVFTSQGWTDLVDAQAHGKYTYTFDGELGSLDHIISSPSLTASITGTDVWEINSPEWSDRGYAFGASDNGTPYRSSDHDPIIVGVASTEPPVAIDIVTINDFHGRIEANGASAGAAVLAGAVAQVRAANPNTIFAAAGDLIGASTFTSFILDDNPTIDALNAAGLDVSAAGNHEFDQGWEDLRDRVQDRADWEYISSNVFLKGTNDTALAPSWVTEMDGVRVGFVGAVTEELESLVSPEGIKDLEVRSIVTSVNAASAALRDGDETNGEADVVILLVHEGAATVEVGSITPDTPLGAIVAGVGDDVSAIVSAHTHLAYNHVIDGRPVVSAGQYGENFGLMRIEVDANTKELVSITNEIKPLTADGSPLYPAVPEVQDIVDDAKDRADVVGAESVGEITDDFLRARQSDGTTENRGGESTIGNFVADVHQWATGADLALMNPGGIRTDLIFASSGSEDPDGNVTFREAATVQPFANSLVTVELTGAQVKSVLEEQWQPDSASRPFLKLGVSEGLTYTYDPTADRGERVTSITLNGAALDLSATYTVAANSFLGGGGDNFFTFAEGANRKDTGRIDLQSMVDWFAENGVATPDQAQRAVGVVLSPASGADGYVVGETVTVDLSSLAFSVGDAAPESVTISVGATEVGVAPIDATVVDASDEVGRASLTFTVPAGSEGAQSLTVHVAETGTTAQAPFLVKAKDGSGLDGNGPDGGGNGGGNGGGGGGLATTGAEVLPFLILGTMLLVAGAAVRTVRRRNIG